MNDPKLIDWRIRTINSLVLMIAVEPNAAWRARLEALLAHERRELAVQLTIRPSDRKAA